MGGRHFLEKFRDFEAGNVPRIALLQRKKGIQALCAHVDIVQALSVFTGYTG